MTLLFRVMERWHLQKHEYKSFVMVWGLILIFESPFHNMQKIKHNKISTFPIFIKSNIFSCNFPRLDLFSAKTSTFAWKLRSLRPEKLNELSCSLVQVNLILWEIKVVNNLLCVFQWFFAFLTSIVPSFIL